MASKKPTLSIGIIFKNEIRCIERCLKSLAPLRKAVFCELVMADTGSTDGSRAVAEQYADILIDFPWVNDFAAARNSVLDRCSGKWYFSIDCDEWLDEKVAELASFLKDYKNFNEAAAIKIRNYKTPDHDPAYALDFLAVRIFRKLPGARYKGVIHEEWTLEDGRTFRARGLPSVVLHHDGYVVMEGAWGKEKEERNHALLEEKLAEDPENVVTLMQCIESSSSENREDYVRKAMAAARAREEYNRCLPAIYRYGIDMASDLGWQELDEWIAEAETRFPNSAFVRLDVAYAAVIRDWNKADYRECVRRGEAYLSYLELFRKGNEDLEAQGTSTIQKSGVIWELTVRIITGGAYLNQEDADPACARAVLEKIDYAALNPGQTENLMNVMRGLQFAAEEDAAPMAAKIWEAISRPEPDEKTAENRRQAFEKTGAKYFAPSNQTAEKARPTFRRYSWTLFRSISSDLGTGANIMLSQDPTEISQLLEGVEKWHKLPIQALDHALAKGAAFPLPSKPLTVEEADMLAARLALSRPGAAAEFALQAARGNLEDFQTASWARALVIAAVKACKWDSPEPDMALCRTFTKVESAFLQLCYAPAALQKENLPILPPLHRFGWYCVQAFETLGSGDTLGYLRLLKEGLRTYESGRPMVKFLSENTQEVQAGLAPAPSQELKELADKMRDMLALLDPNSPMVAAIKQSPDYQQLAYLIEGTAAPVMGGLAQ